MPVIIHKSIGVREGHGEKVQIIDIRRPKNVTLPNGSEEKTLHTPRNSIFRTLIDVSTLKNLYK